MRLFLSTSVVSLILAVIAKAIFGDVVSYLACYIVIELSILVECLDGSVSKEIDVDNKAMLYNTDRATARIISDIEELKK